MADRLSRSALLRHLLFLTAALFAIWAVGYRFGAFDQIFHITFLKKMVYPALYPGDPFLDLRFYHYSYFWYFFVPFLRLGLLEPVMFVVHIFATYLTFWMLWELSITLFNNPLAALITILAFIFPHVGSPGFPLIEDSLLNRTFVMPFVLMAIVLYLRGRRLLAFLLLGLMLNLHALSVSFGMAMLGFDCLIRWRTIGLKTILAGLVLFGLGASPVLFWKVNHTGFDLSLRPDLLNLAGRGVLSSIYYMISAQPILIFVTLCGLGTLGLLLVGLRDHPSPHDRPVKNFTIAIGLTVVVQLITTYWLPLTFIIQLQILRIVFYLLIFGYLYFANTLALRLQDGRLSRAGAAVQVSSFLLITAPFVTWVIWVLRGWLARMRWRQIVAVVLVIGGMLTVALVGGLTNLWQPGYHIYGARTPWVAVQEWAKNNTPIDTTFITPPQMYSQYIPDWRVFSERGTVVTLDALEDIPYDPGALPDWLARFNALAPGAIARFNYNYFTSEQVTAYAFYSLTADDLVRIARQYHASYLVLEKPHSLNFPVVYENVGFVVYDLRQFLLLPSGMNTKESYAPASFSDRRGR